MPEFIKNVPRTKTVILLFFLLLITAMGLRLFLLFTSQHYLDGDESMVGLMSLHIIEKGELPLFWYGIHYNGGGSWEAYIGSLFILLFGYSDISVKLSALFFSILILIFLYLWVKENFSDRMALLAMYFYVFSVSFIAWNLKLRGHLTLIFMMLVQLWIYYRFLFQDKKTLGYAAITGLLSGLAVWCLETSLLLMAIFFIFWYRQEKIFFLKKQFLIFCLTFFFGVIPLIRENIIYNLANLKHLLGKGYIGIETRNFIERIYLLFIKDLPSIFHWNTIQVYPSELPWFVWVGYLIAIIATVNFLIRLWKPLKNWFLSSFSIKTQNILSMDYEKIVFIALYMFIFQIIFTFSNFSLIAPRYLLPIMPSIFLVLALFIDRLLNIKKNITRVFAWLILITWALTGMIVTYSVSKDFTVIDGFTESYAPDLPRLVSELKSTGINRAYSEKFIQYRIIFYSREDIIVSRFRNPRGGGVIGTPPFSMYPEYEKIVENDHRNAAVIFGNQPQILRYFEDYLHSIDAVFKKSKIGGFTYYYNLKPIFDSGDFITFILNQGYSPKELNKYL